MWGLPDADPREKKKKRERRREEKRRKKKKSKRRRDKRWAKKRMELRREGNCDFLSIKHYHNFIYIKKSYL